MSVELADTIFGRLWHAKQDAYSIVIHHNEPLDVAHQLASAHYSLSPEEKEELALALLVEFPDRILNLVESRLMEDKK